MKVLFFASDFKIGLSSLLTAQVCAFVQTGIRLHVVSSEGEQEPGLHARLQEKGIEYTIIENMDAHDFFIQKARSIRRLMKTTGCSHVHVQNNWQLALVACAKCGMRKAPKVIYTLHGFRHNHPIKAKIAKLVIGTALFLCADKVICMCQYLKKEFALLQHKIALLPLGIDDAFFAPSPLPETKGLRIIFPAQFREGKNQDMIIRAFADYLVQTENEESHLTLPGSGPKLDEMKALVDSLGISNRVSFPGQCSKQQIVGLYKNSNVAVVASNSETFGQSIVEPFAMGRIVVSRPVGIAPDIIQHGETGYLFLNQENLTDIFMEIDNQFPAAVTKAAKKLADMFQWTVVACGYKKLINSLK